MKKWRLQNKHERRFKQGHPWVYSNELQESPKGVTAGEIVELCDSGGKFLAYGIANSASLIAFRVLSRVQTESELFAESKITPAFFLARFKTAMNFRHSWFAAEQSFRLVYGEVDSCPGLVIDRYVGRTEGKAAATVYIVQPHSSGMDLALDSVRTALSVLSKESKDPGQSILITRRDAGSREREGLDKLPTQVLDLHTGKEIATPDEYRSFLFTVAGVMGSNIELHADLVGGQKTGFFLDQLQNIKLVEGLLLRKIRNDRPKGLKILDLCSYVGQWSVHLSQTAIERECLPLEVTMVDASDTALKFAEKNMQHLIGQRSVAKSKVAVERLKSDVFEPMPSLKDAAYDVVIADPPALIKNRKHIPQGQHAYVNLMTTAITKVRTGGLIVACSCSQLLSPDDFKMVLDKASRRSGKTVRWIAQGSPSVDHFSLMSFQEGHYLKCWVGQVGEV
ncbi:MAG: class I SAM-dependent rRNA methyltransferase [Bdellovibrionales bacterium]|nr:class I SAM-dependent rRNA methyltransferase [Bdellovibrionales bacterium]